MFELIGHPVSKLRRVAIGPIRDASLPPGASRRLAPGEVKALKESLGKPAKERLRPVARGARSGPKMRRRGRERGTA
jgi:23S rRNA pseudouridine2605 synthase